MSYDKIKRFFIRLYEKAFDEDILSSAAQVAFYFLFALFPLLLFVLALFGFVLGKNNDLRYELFVYLRQLMPASAFDLVNKTLEEIVQGSSGGKLTIGILITIWSASAGIDSLRVALNAVFKIKETRDWWKRKLMSLFLIFAIGISIFFALGIIFYGSKFLNLMFLTVGLPIPSPSILSLLSFLVVLLLLLLTFELLYNFIPNHNPRTWKWITPGAIVGIVLWLLLSKGFSIYLDYFNSYAKTYGSLGAIIVLMFWLYLTALVMLVGGTINAVLGEFSIGKYEKTPSDDVVSEEKTTDKSNAQQAENAPLPDSVEKSENNFPAAKSTSALKENAHIENTVPPKPDGLPEINNKKTIEKSVAALYDPTLEKPPADIPALNVIIGSAVGFLMGLIFSKKNR